jgi:hypothetical protein
MQQKEQANIDPKNTSDSSVQSHEEIPPNAIPAAIQEAGSDSQEASFSPPNSQNSLNILSNSKSALKGKSPGRKERLTALAKERSEYLEQEVDFKGDGLVSEERGECQVVFSEKLQHKKKRTKKIGEERETQKKMAKERERAKKKKRAERVDRMRGVMETLNLENPKSEFSVIQEMALVKPLADMLDDVSEAANHTIVADKSGMLAKKAKAWQAAKDEVMADSPEMRVMFNSSVIGNMHNKEQHNASYVEKIKLVLQARRQIKSDQLLEAEQAEKRARTELARYKAEGREIDIEINALVAIREAVDAKVEFEAEEILKAEAAGSANSLVDDAKEDDQKQVMALNGFLSMEELIEAQEIVAEESTQLIQDLKYAEAALESLGVSDADAKEDKSALVKSLDSVFSKLEEAAEHIVILDTALKTCAAYREEELSRLKRKLAKDLNHAQAALKKVLKVRTKLGEAQDAEEDIKAAIQSAARVFSSFFSEFEARTADMAAIELALKEYIASCEKKLAQVEQQLVADKLVPRQENKLNEIILTAADKSIRKREAKAVEEAIAKVKDLKKILELVERIKPLREMQRVINQAKADLAKDLEDAEITIERAEEALGEAGPLDQPDAEMPFALKVGSENIDPLQAALRSAKEAFKKLEEESEKILAIEAEFRSHTDFREEELTRGSLQIDALVPRANPENDERIAKAVIEVIEQTKINRNGEAPKIEALKKALAEHEITQHVVTAQKEINSHKVKLSNYLKDAQAILEKAGSILNLEGHRNFLEENIRLIKQALARLEEEIKIAEEIEVAFRLATKEPAKFNEALAQLQSMAGADEQEADLNRVIEAVFEAIGSAESRIEVDVETIERLKETLGLSEREAKDDQEADNKEHESESALELGPENEGRKDDQEQQLIEVSAEIQVGLREFAELEAGAQDVFEAGAKPANLNEKNDASGLEEGRSVSVNSLNRIDEVASSKASVLTQMQKQKQADKGIKWAIGVLALNILAGLITYFTAPAIVFVVLLGILPGLAIGATTTFIYKDLLQNRDIGVPGQGDQVTILGYPLFSKTKAKVFGPTVVPVLMIGMVGFVGGSISFAQPLLSLMVGASTATLVPWLFVAFVVSMVVVTALVDAHISDTENIMVKPIGAGSAEKLMPGAGDVRLNRSTANSCALMRPILKGAQPGSGNDDSYSDLRGPERKQEQQVVEGLNNQQGVLVSDSYARS